jgi:hypothetical protein
MLEDSNASDLFRFHVVLCSSGNVNCLLIPASALQVMRGQGPLRISGPASGSAVLSMVQSGLFPEESARVELSAADLRSVYVPGVSTKLTLFSVVFVYGAHRQPFCLFFFCLQWLQLYVSVRYKFRSGR